MLYERGKNEFSVSALSNVLLTFQTLFNLFCLVIYSETYYTSIWDSRSGSVFPLIHFFINISLKTLNGKEYSCNAGPTRDASSTLGREDPLEEGMATHSSILAWRIPWANEAGRLQSTRLQSQTWLSDWHFHFHRKYLRWNIVIEPGLVVS